MSARIVDEDGNTVTLRIIGKLLYDDFQSVQRAVAEVIGRKNTVRVLILGEDFVGWEKSASWGDVTFNEQFDAHVQKMAIVGEKEWEDLVILFTARGLRPFPIEFFLPNEIGKAREWLAKDT